MQHQYRPGDLARTIAMNKILSRDAILTAQDLTTELVNVPEWGGDVYVKSLTGSERDAFEGSLLSTDAKGKNKVTYTNIRAKLVAKTVCDENGVRLFTDDDIKDLSKKSAAALQRVFEVAQRLSGLSDEDVKELTGELKNDQSEGSTSD
jgi:hypothetical protein